MKKRFVMVGLFVVVMILSFFQVSGFGLADISEAENALSVQGFDPSAVYGSTFSDSISPYTGALTISQTDVSLPGRNGLGVVLPRVYNSNVFLHINDLPNGQFDCSEINNFVCDDCEIASSTLPGQKYDVLLGGVVGPVDATRTIGRCELNNGEDTSYIKAKMLGRGWDMTLGKIETPTPILFRTLSSNADVIPTYEYLSMRGINSDSMTLFNNKVGLIHPSMFRQHNALKDWGGVDLNLNDYPYWNIALAYREATTRSISEGGGEFSIVPKFADPYVDMVAYYGLRLLGLYSLESDLQAEREAFGGFENENGQWIANYHPGNGEFTLYTSDISPVHFNYLTEENQQLPGGIIDFQNPSVTYCNYGDIFYSMEYPLKCIANNVGQAGPEVLYKSRDGKGYLFENYVGFFGEFDDLQTGVTGLESEYITRWAENPYAGTYLTKITDSFGNYIDIEYAGPTVGTHTGNPFVSGIKDTYGKDISFVYSDGDNDGVTYDLNTRLEQINYPSLSNPYQTLRVDYEYYSNVPLLWKVSLLDGENIVPGTTTIYLYGGNNNPNSNLHPENLPQELTKIILPTGMIIEYEYVWAKLPSYELNKGYSDSYLDDSKFLNLYDGTKIPMYDRRVVHKKKVTNGGACPSDPTGQGTNPCVWTYDYQLIGQDIIDAYGTTTETCFMGNEGYGEFDGDDLGICIKHTITDPFGTKVIKKVLPSTISSKRKHNGASELILSGAGGSQSGFMTTCLGCSDGQNGEGQSCDVCSPGSYDYPYCGGNYYYCNG